MGSPRPATQADLQPTGKLDFPKELLRGVGPVFIGDVRKLNLRTVAAAVDRAVGVGAALVITDPHRHAVTIDQGHCETVMSKSGRMIDARNVTHHRSCPGRR